MERMILRSVDGYFVVCDVTSEPTEGFEPVLGGRYVRELTKTPFSAANLKDRAEQWAREKGLLT